MKIGFLIRRMNQFPHVEGTLREAVSRKHEAHILCRQGSASKDGTSPHLFPKRAQGMAEIHKPCDTRPDLDAVVVPSALGFNIPAGAGRPIRVALQTTWSDLIHLPALDWDVVYTWSPLWGRAWHDAHPDQVATNMVPVGLPIAEQTNWLRPGDARELYGLPKWPAKFLLYYPFPFDTHDMNPWLRWGYRYSPWGDRSVVRECRRIADQYAWPLVVKSRKKTTVPKYTRDRADVIVEDAMPGEASGLQIMMLSHLLVHHRSIGAGEAAAAGVRAVCVSPRGWTAYAGRGDSFDMKEGSFFNWSGVSSFLRPGLGFNLDGHLAPVNMIERTRFIYRYLGEPDFKVGHRIITDLEVRLARRGIR